MFVPFGCLYRGNIFGLLCVSVDLHSLCHGASSTKNATSFPCPFHFFFRILFFLHGVGAVHSPQCYSVVCFAENSIASGNAESRCICTS